MDLVDRTQQRAGELDTLRDGALAAGTGGFLVLGLVTGGVLWIPFGMAASLSAFKLGKYFLARQIDLVLYSVDYVVARKVQIFESSLPEDEKRKLSSTLDQVLNLSSGASASRPSAQAPPPARHDEAPQP